MEKKFSRLLLVLTLTLALIGAPPTASIGSGQQKKPGSEPDQYPTFLKIYSKDGRESLTAMCTPIDPNPVVNQVTCKFIHVRFELPDKAGFLEEALKANPNLWKNPKKSEQEFRKALETVKQDACSSSSKGRIAIETKMRGPEIGPKRKSLFQQLIAACSDKDPTVFFNRMVDLKRRTCGLWVDHFTLEFKKVREGQWLYRQETPGLFSKVLKIYELTTADSLVWTLSETRVPTEGSEEKPARTVWSWENYSEYELPCEFISHGLIQVP